MTRIVTQSVAAMAAVVLTLGTFGSIIAVPPANAITNVPALA